MLATEKKLPSALMDEASLEKISRLTSTAGVVYSGIGPDSRVLVRKARKAAQQYRLVYGEDMPTSQLVRDIASVMQEFTQSGFAAAAAAATTATALCVSRVRDSRTNVAARQWRPTVRRIVVGGRMGRRQGPYAVSGRPKRLVLGLEGIRDRQECSERTNVPGEAVRRAHGHRSCIAGLHAF